MKIDLDLHDAERLIESLQKSVSDLFSEARASLGGNPSEAARARRCIQYASSFAHVQARFLDRLSDVVSGEAPLVLEETDEHDELRIAAAARRASVTPIRSDGPEAA